MARAQTLKMIYGVERDPVAAMADASGTPLTQFTPAPMYPPDDWFTDEAADNAPARLRWFPNGMVAGVVAPAGRCLLDGTGSCWKVPRPADGRGSILHAPEVDDGGDYRMAHVGETVLESGLTIATAVLAGPGGHADPYASVRQARQHYDNTAWGVAQGRYVWSDIAGGLVFVGAGNPDIGELQVRSVRASAASVDFRWIVDENQYRLIATCLVNVGGLPSRYAAAADDGFVLTEGRIWAIAAELGLDKPAVAAAARGEDISTEDVFAAILAAAPPFEWETTSIEEVTPPPATGEVRSDHEAMTAAPQEDPMRRKLGQTIAHAPDGPASAPATPAPIPTPGAPAPCVDCGGDQPAHTAAYAVEPIPTENSILGPSASPSLTSGDQVTWGNGSVGMFTDTMSTADGGTALIVFVEEGGLLDIATPIVVPADQATATGNLYQWVDPADIPLDTMVLQPSGESPTTEVIEEAGEEAGEGETMGGTGETETEDMAMMASLGSRILAGRVPGTKAMTRAEAQVAAVKAAVAAVEARHAEDIARLVEGQAALTAAVGTMVDAVATVHAKSLASEVADLGAPPALPAGV